MYGLGELYGQPARAGDPRRFFIELALAARYEFGPEDPVDVAVAHDALRQHPLLAGLSDVQIADLGNLAVDALRQAGGGLARSAAIAKGLPGRAARLTGFALTEDLWRNAPPTPLRCVLPALLRLDRDEVDALVAAGQRGAALPALGALLARARVMLGPVARMLAIRAVALDALNGDHLARACAFVAGLIDLEVDGAGAATTLRAAFAEVGTPGVGVYATLAAIAASLTRAGDRYWIMVYALAAEVPATIRSWRMLPFVVQLQTALDLTDVDVDLAVVDALAFSAALPRPIV